MMIKQRIEQSAIRITRSWVYHHAGGFINHHHGIVFIDDIQGDILGFKARIFFNGRLQRQHFIAMQLGFRLELSAIYR